MVFVSQSSSSLVSSSSSSSSSSLNSLSSENYYSKSTAESSAEGSDSEYEEEVEEETYENKFKNGGNNRRQIYDSETEVESEEDDNFESDESEEDEIYGKRKQQKKKSSLNGNGISNRNYYSSSSVKYSSKVSSSSSSNNKKKKKKLPAATKSKDKKLYNAGVVSDEEEEDSDSSNDSDRSDSDFLKKKRHRHQLPNGVIEFYEKDTAAHLRDLDVLGDWNEERNEFLVKWKGRSWRWAEWLPAEAPELLAPQSRRKVENFIRKIEQEREDVEAEEGSDEKFSSFLETSRYNFEVNWREIERIVAMQPTRDGGNYYLCKWRGLGYGESTWEWEGDVRELKGGQEAIDKFLSFQYKSKSKSKSSKSQNTSNDNSKSSYKTTKFHRYTEQPDFLPKELSLRDYQLDGLNWLLFSWSRRVNVILADEMGLGKTIQSVAFLAALKEDYSFVGPSLIVVPLSTIDAWQREFGRWAPRLNVVVYVGDAVSRAVARNYEFDNFDVLLTTYELALKDHQLLAGQKWRMLMVDEGHRLKNAASQLYDVLFSLVPQGGRVLITGTPLQNSLGELYCLLRFLMPDKFYDYDEFLALYSVDFRESSTDQNNNSDNNNINNNNNRLNELHGLIKPHILRRLKRDVEHSLPGKTEKIIRVDLSALQKQLYRYILTRNYRDLKRTQEAAGNRATGGLLNILGELKKVCNHPMLLGTGSPALQAAQANENTVWSVEESGKLALLERLLRRLKDDGHRVLIFSQSVRMLDILQNFVRSEGYASQRLDGSTPSTARHMAITAFNADDSKDFVFLLSTRAGGLGINLATADTVIIYDSDWNPQNDLQAMARAHRIGQKRMVRIFRLVSAGTVEEEILERAKKKMVLDHLVIQQLKKTRKTESESASDVQAILKFGAKALFESDAPAIPASAIDLDALLSEDAVGGDSEQSAGAAGGDRDDGEFLSQFRMADLGAAPNWDEIIPEVERRRAEEEERQSSELAKEVELQEALLTAATGRRSKAANSTVSPTKKSQIKIVEVPIDSALVLFKSGDESALKAYDALSHFGVFVDDSSWEERLVSRLNEILSSHSTTETPVPSHFRVIRGSPLQKASISGLIERIAGLKTLRHTLVSFLKRPWSVELTMGDFEQFRHPLLGVKAPQAWPFTSYSVIHDSALLSAVGIFGYGNWQRIRQELADSSSGSQWMKLHGPQITRRVDYLLKELVINLGKMNGHVTKKSKIDDLAVISSSNRSAAVKKEKEAEADGDEKLIAKFKRPFKPIRHVLVELEELKQSVQSLDSKEVGTRLTAHLRELGDFIDSDEALRSDPEVWEFIGAFWPFQMGSMGPELKQLYASLQHHQ